MTLTQIWCPAKKSAKSVCPCMIPINFDITQSQIRANKVDWERNGELKYLTHVNLPLICKSLIRFGNLANHDTKQKFSS